MNSINIIKDLKLKGHKNTKVRQALVEILLGTSSPLSISELLKNLSEKQLEPNKSTVYREIDFLKNQHHFLQEVDFGDGKKRYEISQNHHHHIVCIKCNTIKDIPMEKDLNSKEQKIYKQLKFKPIGHSLEFFGLCRDCQ